MKNFYIYKRLNYLLSRLEIRLRIFFITHVYSKFSKTVKKQLNNYKKIPIVIVNFNQLKTLKLLVDYLIENNYKNIHIVDNNSSYKPLLSYYKTINNHVNVILNKVNHGHMVFWEQESFFKKISKGYYVLTDPDVLPIEECPKDFLKFFLDLLKASKTRYKVGFSLKIDDIPDSYPLKTKVLAWEKRFWKLNTKEGHFLADIDTTFALYRPKMKTKKFFYSGLRTKFPYQAKHFGWYINPEKLSEEEIFYNNTADSSSSWNFDKNGNLITPFY